MGKRGQAETPKRRKKAAPAAHAHANANGSLLTARELAAELGVGWETVLRWARAGRIPAVRLSARVVRFELAAVLEAVER